MAEWGAQYDDLPLRLLRARALIPSPYFLRSLIAKRPIEQPLLTVASSLAAVVDRHSKRST